MTQLKTFKEQDKPFSRAFNDQIAKQLPQPLLDSISSWVWGF